MIPGMTGAAVLAGGPTGPLSFQQMIEAAIGTSSLDFVLDAGDSASYDGSSQTWVDTHSTNDFYSGATSGVEGSDLEWSGEAGRKSSAEYFSFGGNDWFTETAAHTFAEAWHKDNGAFTLVAVFWPVLDTNSQYLFINCTPEVGRGVGFGLNDTEKLRLIVEATSLTALTLETAGSVTVDAWNFVAVALNEATGAAGATMQIGATQSSFTSTYNTPAATGSDQPYHIGDHQGNRLNTGSRLACIAGWSRRLSDAELTALRTALQARFTGV